MAEKSGMAVDLRTGGKEYYQSIYAKSVMTCHRIDIKL